MKRLLAALILLSGCVSSPASDTLILPPDPPPVQVVAPPRPKPPATQPIANLSPPEIIAASETARAHAAGYVAWKHSKVENIDRLTTLTSSLNLAIARLQAGRGKYTQADVSAARTALQDLRTFLANKGD